jgi:hypothetical protein
VSAVEAPVRLGIDLSHGESFACTDFSLPLYQQLNSGKYDVCATMPLPRTREAWEAEHRTARKRAWRAEAKGYYARPFAREVYVGDMYEINNSRPYRQGRPMSEGYREQPTAVPLPDYPCDLHAIRYYGVFWPEPHGTSGGDGQMVRERLVAYMQVYRAGDLMLVSQSIGHGEHEDYGVMHLLHRHALVAESAFAPGVAVYNRFDSGTPGLRQFKSWIGYEETAVEWLP